MKAYLATLPTRPHAHQRAFALAVSGAFTLLIFSVWSFVVFNHPEVAANNNQNSLALVSVSDLAAAGTTSAHSPTPFQDILAGIKVSFQSLRETLLGAKSKVETVNLNGDYTQIRNSVIQDGGQQ